VPLSPLQERVAAVVNALPDAEELALAGGAALISWDIGDRMTRDLDFFAKHRETVDRLAPVAEQALRSEGLDVEVVRASPGFVRLQISDDNEATELDLAWDYRMRELQHTQHGRVLDRDELAADKMLALYGRAEARDFVDVYRLRALYSRERLCGLAREKDRGFEASAFAEALRGIDRRDRIEFDVDATTFDALTREFREWQRDLAIGRYLEQNHDLPDPRPPEVGLAP
jgi:predicted nucleotidyltransferase component of viral defense system